VAWIRHFTLFHSKRHPNKMGGVEAESLLTHLAAREHIAASTQNQALSALSGATQLTPASHLYFTQELSPFGGPTAVLQNRLC
jgi:hypothetical protein